MMTFLPRPFPIPASRWWVPSLIKYLFIKCLLHACQWALCRRHTCTHTHTHSIKTWTSLVAQTLRNLPVTQETPVQSLGQKDPLEKEMATHSSILAWKIQWMEEPGRLQSMGSQRVGHDWATSLLRAYQWAQCRRHTHTHTQSIKTCS